MRVDRDGRHRARAREEHLCCCTSGSCGTLPLATAAAPIALSTTAAPARAPFRCSRTEGVVGGGRGRVWEMDNDVCGCSAFPSGGLSLLLDGCGGGKRQRQRRIAAT